jgi:hypothetical protein
MPIEPRDPRWKLADVRQDVDRVTDDADVLASQMLALDTRMGVLMKALRAEFHKSGKPPKESVDQFRAALHDVDNALDGMEAASKKLSEVAARFVG